MTFHVNDGGHVAEHNRVATGLAAAYVKPGTGVPLADLAPDVAAKYGPYIVFTDPAIGGVGDGATDNTNAFNTAIAALPNGGTLIVPPGIYCIGGTTTPVTGGITIMGTGWQFSNPATGPLTYGSVFRATAAVNYVIKLGAEGDQLSSEEVSTGASAWGITVDANNIATNALVTRGRRNRVERCQIANGTSRALYVNGQNSIIVGNNLHQPLVGDVVFVQGYPDHKIFDNQIFGAGNTNSNAGLNISGIANVIVRGNHIWSGSGGSAQVTAANIHLQGAGLQDIQIINNVIEGNLGPEILFNCGGSVELKGVTVTGNVFFNSNITDNTYAVFRLHGSGAGSLHDVVITGNTFLATDATHRYSAVMQYAVTGHTVSRFLVDTNVGLYVKALTTGTTAGEGITWGMNTIQVDGSTTVRTVNDGVATFSGTGSQTAFTIAHSMGAAVKSVTVTPGSVGAASNYYVTSDATNITVTFTTAPASGTNNVVLNWRATL